MNSVRMGGIKIRSYKTNIYSVPQYFGSPTGPKLPGIYIPTIGILCTYFRKVILLKFHFQRLSFWSLLVHVSIEKQ